MQKQPTCKVKTFKIATLHDMDVFAHKIANIIKINDIICFNADLGMGKTTFCKFLFKHLGVKENIISPTFPIIQTYEYELNNIKTNLHHIDLYRIDTCELFELGIDEILYDGICFIEWSNKLEDHMPNDYVKFTITQNEEAVRIITIEYNTITHKHWDFLV